MVGQGSSSISADMVANLQLAGTRHHRPKCPLAKFQVHLNLIFQKRNDTAVFTEPWPVALVSWFLLSCTCGLWYESGLRRPRAKEFVIMIKYVQSLHREYPNGVWLPLNPIQGSAEEWFLRCLIPTSCSHLAAGRGSCNLGYI